MKKSIKILLFISVLLTVSAFATCYFGVESEISKIPAERRAVMSDFDWIGVNWIAFGTIILLSAALSASFAIIIWFRNRN